MHRDTLHIVHRDTLRELRTVHDSVFLHDSVYFEGATLVKERTRDRWHVRRDTVWRSRVDTVRAASHHADARNEKTRKQDNCKRQRNNTDKEQKNHYIL